jgi:hypothetical protein
MESWYGTPSTSLKGHPYVRYLTVSSCPRGSGAANHFYFLAHSFPFGKESFFSNALRIPC